ncbi:hypothetical protein [Streptomyces sp. SBT349]|uniref:hypothetical protein n=1 Tax=Streptomyces sp. SBT349 TaxID=1580539 RepID=UPI001F1824FF|nr:hypothetical protein [Streptomyces sp. SBT349]
MKLQPSFEPLAIHRADEEEAAQFLGAQLPSYGSLFLLNDGSHYVCASTCSWHEDQGDHRTPSRFGPLRGTE